MGMIVIGFPGIGKTSISFGENKFVDLESSCFNIIDPVTNKKTKPDNWEKLYVSVAYDLAKQGKYVCVSNHNLVIDEILDRKQKDSRLDEYPIVFVYPKKNLKDRWIERLTDRYNSSVQIDKDIADKNKAALDAVAANYDKWIDALECIDPNNITAYGNNVYKIPIIGVDYDLAAALKRFIDAYDRYESKLSELCKIREHFMNTYCVM
nr:MAG TPA: Metallophosphoesterase repair, P-loop phosphotransferase, polynucleotide [Caudoviricetes sp.]